MSPESRSHSPTAHQITQSPNKRTLHINLHLHGLVRIYDFNPLKTKRRPLYLKTQFVPRCKHFSSRLLVANLGRTVIILSTVASFFQSHDVNPATIPPKGNNGHLPHHFPFIHHPFYHFTAHSLSQQRNHPFHAYLGAPYGLLTLHILLVSVYRTVVTAYRSTIILKPPVLGSSWNLHHRVVEELNKTKQRYKHADGLSFISFSSRFI